LNVLINGLAYGPVTEETFHAMENLKVHIRKGCLSDIPPNCGTERNKYIHSILNRSYHFTSYGSKENKGVFGDAHVQVGVPAEWVTAREKLGTHCEESIEPIKRVRDRSELQSNTSLGYWQKNVVSQSEGGLL